VHHDRGVFSHTKSNKATATRQHPRITNLKQTMIAIPSEYICPITLDILECPLASKHGFNFEKDAIVAWLRNGSLVCPLTRQPLTYSSLIHNNQLAKEIEAWRREHGVPLKPSQDGCTDDANTVSSGTAAKIDTYVQEKMTHIYGTSDLPFGEQILYHGETPNDESGSTESSTVAVAARSKTTSPKMISPMRSLQKVLACRRTNRRSHVANDLRVTL
jgi:uncharacterized protein YbaR (Trm112 family)